ncbi:MAG: hypothetical protein ACT6WE_29255, partial [Shinella sp.]|uniref:hypothetical protein n=1 Tax=Shinella sp. TaxID=1870904 RepID=UPI00403583A2
PDQVRRLGRLGLGGSQGAHRSGRQVIAGLRAGFLARSLFPSGQGPTAGRVVGAREDFIDVS